jgi:hypothetical protein
MMQRTNVSSVTVERESDDWPLARAGLFPAGPSESYFERACHCRWQCRVPIRSFGCQ